MATTTPGLSAPGSALTGGRGFRKEPDMFRPELRDILVLMLWEAYSAGAELGSEIHLDQDMLKDDFNTWLKDWLADHG